MRKEANVAFFVEASSIEDKFSRDRTALVVEGRGGQKSKRTHTQLKFKKHLKLKLKLKQNQQQQQQTVNIASQQHEAEDKLHIE